VVCAAILIALMFFGHMNSTVEIVPAFTSDQLGKRR
jgi:hypothetical protein